MKNSKKSIFLQFLKNGHKMTSFAPNFKPRLLKYSYRMQISISGKKSSRKKSLRSDLGSQSRKMLKKSDFLKVGCVTVLSITSVKIHQFKRLRLENLRKCVAFKMSIHLLNNIKRSPSYMPLNTTIWVNFG